MRRSLSVSTTQEALASGTYDVFIVQGHEYEPVEHPEQSLVAVRAFDRAVTQAGGCTVLLMTWGFPFRPFIGELAAAYDTIGRELGEPVIPAGLIDEDCRRRPLPHRPPNWLISDPDHRKGGLHQNEKGSAENAYATFATPTGRNSSGVNFVAPGHSNRDELMKRLSDHAWARVEPRLVGEGGPRVAP